MKNFLGVIFLTCVLLVFLPIQMARAQACDTLFEVITTLRPPTFGFPTVWDAKYGHKDSITQIASGVPQEGGTVFVFGRRISKEDYQPREIILAEINRRGRALKEEKYPAKEAEQPVKLIQLGSGFVALSNMRGGSNNEEKWARLSWYDANGKYEREKIIKDATFDYEGMGLVHATEDNGFVTILKAINREDETDMNGMLMRLTSGGEVMWRRAYRPGIPNMLHALVPIDEKNYIAAGQIRLEDGRMAGWAMKLGFDGAIHWQRTYPRGDESLFRHAAISINKTAEGRGFLLSGDSDPLGKGNRAAWIMAIDALGEPLWQRYYRRDDYGLSGNWVVNEQDGRIILIMNAEAAEGKDGFSHVRMLTLSPRGVLIQDESYYEGLMATATDYAPGWNGERIMTAVIEDDMGETEDDGEKIVVVGLVPDEEAEATEEEQAPEESVQKGWTFVATALDPYEDPCGVITGQ